MELINILTATYARLTKNSGHQKIQGGKATAGNDYESSLGPTGYFWMHGYKVVRGHTRISCTKRNDGYMENPTKSDTIGGITNNSGWVGRSKG